MKADNTRFKVRCISNSRSLIEKPGGRFEIGSFDGAETDLTIGKVYEALDDEHGMLRIWDDSGEDYLYPSSKFERLRAVK